VLDVQLLGRPSVCLDGVPVDGPRGHKTWGLLAYLVGVGVPVPRDRLVALLFPDAEDGLAALRWNLAQLRRAVRSPQAFRYVVTQKNTLIVNAAHIVELTELAD